MEIKVVGKSGQISLGKAMAGVSFILETLTDGDILLKHAVVVPVNERWLHEPAMKQQLARADEWMRNNPAKQTKLEDFDPKGNLHFPEKCRDVYGKHVRLRVLSTAQSLPGKTMDPMKYSNTLDWPVDGLAYQKQARGEWE